MMTIHRRFKTPHSIIDDRYLIFGISKQGNHLVVS